jgi:hypothetical protein
MFPIAMTVNVTTPAQLAALTALINGEGPAMIRPNRDETPKKDAPAPKAQPDAPTPTPESSDAGKTEAAPATAAPAASTSSLTYPETAKFVTKVMQVKGKDTAVAMLKGLGLSNAKEAKPEQYQSIVDAAKTILGEE